MSLDKIKDGQTNKKDTERGKKKIWTKERDERLMYLSSMIHGLQPQWSTIDKDLDVRNGLSIERFKFLKSRQTVENSSIPQAEEIQPNNPITQQQMQIDDNEKSIAMSVKTTDENTKSLKNFFQTHSKTNKKRANEKIPEHLVRLSQGKRHCSEKSASSTDQRVVVPRLSPYLDTINRQFLDFDFEKLCSVSLSRINVYACLVCGKYFQGRGNNTHAYTHSVAEYHHVFLNLHTLKFYCLPDSYEIIDSSLDDIKYVVNPTFDKHQIAQLDSNDKLSKAIDGSMYFPGIVGMNNIKANDYCNVVWQALSHVTPLRDYFIVASNYSKVKRPPGNSSYQVIIQRFGELMKKLWNPRNFKAHVSPHEMLKAVLWSNKKLQFTEQGDPAVFLSWFLNALHIALNGTKKKDSSIVYKTFLGHMRIFTRKIPPLELEESQRSELLNTDEYGETVTESPFLYLRCDLPPPPLFKDVLNNIIPQVNLYTLLNKFNAVSENEYKTNKDNCMKRFEVRELPPFLILYFKRFTKNTSVVEKNPTIVNFPVKNVDFGDILTPEVKAMHPCTTYELVANIVHDGEPSHGTYRVHILHKATGQWYELQDLHVTKISPQMLTLTEAYIQIYELRKDDAEPTNGKT